MVTAANNEDTDAVRRMIRTDGHMTYHEIQASLGINMSQTQSILHKYLGTKKLCSQWIPHNLTEFQKTDRVTRAMPCLPDQGRSVKFMVGYRKAHSVVVDYAGSAVQFYSRAGSPEAVPARRQSCEGHRPRRRDPHAAPAPRCSALDWSVGNLFSYVIRATIPILLRVESSLKGSGDIMNLRAPQKSLIRLGPAGKRHLDSMTSPTLILLYLFQNGIEFIRNRSTSEGHFYIKITGLKTLEPVLC
ncbi:hypothetical protein EVAR_16204_1 [Eumeta japonica]|uniref:Histone-lysine N-methyltransferase SETMAR n=1 Tax=Eumeta variegata TaxID=151549 RepID=A0A4C1U5W1_EUMVA|nr:hypothetical protein EVAR_16204_1 [Eumeta japonica]